MVKPRFFFSIPNNGDLEKVELEQQENSWSYVLKDERIKGIKYSEKSGSYLILYTCGICNHRQMRSFSKSAYHEGVVIVQCEECDKRHLVADNLKWFDDFTQNIEQIMEGLNQKVVRVDPDEETKKLLRDKMKKEE